MGHHADFDNAVHTAYHSVYLRGDYDNLDAIRAVYDAAARILNDKPADHISAADVWRLRAAYIDAHAAYWAGNSDYTPVSDAANALSAATTPTNEVT
jgi:hypothetical protein